ncbi:MAG: hypothetical protein RJA98_2079 [Pseudomonadota bacterium]|jgi:BirA family biotin operon repressor/biotin-[acetyl-CoA-carboxylase] ligase
MSDAPLSSASLAPIHWGAEALWLQIEPLLPQFSIEVVPRLASTNTVLLDRVRASQFQGDADSGVQLRRSVESGAFGRLGRRSADAMPCLLVAEHQTAGRGRHGKEWASAPGSSLTFSLALTLSPADWSGLSLAVGVALAEALDPPLVGSAPRLLLKWPNDLWLRDDAAPGGGRKLGGILIETVLAGAERMAVIGVGLNVAPQAAALAPASAAYGVACLHELDPHTTAPSALAAVAEPLVRALQQFERDGWAAFASRFAARDLLAGRAITSTQPGLAEGVARGVGADGGLLVEAADGRIHALTSGEVSVRPARSAAPVPVSGPSLGAAEAAPPDEGVAC